MVYKKDIKEKTQKIEKDIVKYYLSTPMSINKVCQKFKISYPTVRKVLYNNNIDIYTRAQIYNPNLEENYFKNIDTEAKAYFLGLLIADGCVFFPNDKNRQHSISISLKADDSYIINQFKKEIGAKTEVIIDKRGCANFACRSDIMAQDLSLYGVVPKKTFSTFLPDIDKKLMSHLLRGILDGDGNIGSHIKKNGKHFHQICYCGSITLIEQIKNFFEKELGVSKRKIYHYPTLSQINYNAIVDVLTIGDFLYKDATIFLQRKKNKFLDFKNHYNL